MRISAPPAIQKGIIPLFQLSALGLLLAWGCAGGTPAGETDDMSTGGTGGTTGGGSSTGGQLSASGGGSSTGGQSAEPTGEIIESDDGDSFELISGDVAMTVTRADGGRIASFRVGNVETLVQSGSAEQFGSVFWPSPQTWEWPTSSSISEIDLDDYVATRDGISVTLTSQFNATVGISVVKKFTPRGDGAIVVDYRMVNSGIETVAVAPWQLSRVAEGIAFFPSGPAGSLEKSNLDVQRISGVTWYAYTAEGLAETPKLFEDGAEGWLAFAVPQDQGGALVVQQFNDITSGSFAPGESEIEFFASSSGQYFEVEHQGAYAEILPGAQASSRTTWRGVRLEETAPAVGNEAYLTRARALARLPSN